MEKNMQEIIDLIKKSREEIGEEKFNELTEKVDNDLKAKLGEEKWKVYLAANGDKEIEDKLIEEIGAEKYNSLLSEVVAELKSELKK